MISFYACLSTGIFTPKPLKRSASAVVPPTLHPNTSSCGDLTSGQAFDNGCVCWNSSEGVLNDLVGKVTECNCGAPRLKSQLHFIQAFMTIGAKLQQLPTKELRSKPKYLKAHEKSAFYFVY